MTMVCRYCRGRNSLTAAILIGTIPCAGSPWPPGRQVPGLVQEWTVFTDTGQRLGDADTRCVALGDLDGDGDLDALVTNAGAPSRVWLNAGDGAFRDSGMTLPSGGCGTLGDVDGDGDQDAFLVGPANRVLLNPGNGRLESGEEFGEGGGSGILLSDLDGDGRPEAFITRFGFPEGLPNQVWTAAEAPAWQFVTSLPSSFPSMHPAAGDLNRDGQVDLVVANQADAEHEPVPDEIWWGRTGSEREACQRDQGTGGPGFNSEPTYFGSSCTYEVALGDLDSDGDLDAFTANAPHARKADPADRVFINPGDGSLADTGQNLGEDYSLAVELGDLDGDGDTDAVVGTLGGGTVVWLNDGRGVFQRHPTILKTGNAMGLALGDLDGDGDLDLFVGNNTWREGDGANQVWLNRLNDLPHQPTEGHE